uniref:F-box associated domain-containing protein n=1 Tax=Leersia perrieri TaxID=77586 RepID=A0A0D9WFY4_9ORYZ
MSCKLSRQSLHMVSSGGRGLYSLSHMNISGLFYPSTAEADAAQAKANKMNGINTPEVVGSISLPRPSVHYEPFSPSNSNPHSSMNMFALFGKNKILCSDAMGYTSVYNKRLHSFLGMPMLNSPKGPKRIVVYIPRTAAHAKSDFEIDPNTESDLFIEMPHGDHNDSLYIMDMVSGKPCCFEALIYYPVGHWRWRPLLPPPFLRNPEYKAPDNTAFAVVDGTKICVSSATATYLFDTVDRKWSKAGDWVMPILSNAEYVPELRLWIGLSASSPFNLCAMNLSNTAVGTSDVLPTMQHIRLDVDPPKDWLLKKRTLVNLGYGKFCVTKFFESIANKVVVFTGVEMVTSGEGELGIRAVKHKSECVVSDNIEYVL